MKRPIMVSVRELGPGVWMLGIGLLALAVVGFAKLGGWYDGWREIARIDPALASRTMLRAVRGGLAVLSLVVALLGTGVAVQGWRTIQLRRFPPLRNRRPTVEGEQAEQFGRLILGLALFGAGAVIVATWLVGERLAERAVSRTIEQVQQQAARRHPRRTPIKPRAQPTVGVFGRSHRNAHDRSAQDRAEEERDALREIVLLHCMPEDRMLCTGTMKVRLQQWLRPQLEDGTTCAALAEELTVPLAGIQPWCGRLRKQLVRDQ